MNIDQTRALRKLTALHGRAIVSKLLPVVANRGFGAICEISVNHPWSVKDDGYIQIPHADAEWVPMFSFDNQRLWEVAAGYVAPTGVPAISIMSSQYPGVVTHGSGGEAGLFLARLIAAMDGKVYISAGTHTTRAQMLWDESKE